MSSGYCRGETNKVKYKLPKRVTGWTNRQSKRRYYYLRLPRQKAVRLPGQPWSNEMMAAIEAAQSGKPPKKQPRQYVYFLLYNRQVKIGTSTNVRNRLKALQTGLPGKVRIHYRTPGDEALEGQLHRLFAPDHVSGEWFTYSAAIARWIKADRQRRNEQRTKPPLKVAHLCGPPF